MSTSDRYIIGRDLQPPFEIHLTIRDAETLTAEQLHADMSRIEAAILRCLAEIENEVTK